MTQIMMHSVKKRYLRLDLQFYKSEFVGQSKSKFRTIIKDSVFIPDKNNIII